MDKQPTTFALCVYLDPSAPLALEEGSDKKVARLANYQWLQTPGPRASTKSRWLGAADDPAMTGGLDFLAVYVVDMSGEMPEQPTFIPTWKHRTTAGPWTDGGPPYSEAPLTPVAQEVENPPGLTGCFKTWFFAGTALDKPDEAVTYSLTGAAIGVGPDQTYWVDPEMEIEP